MMQPTPVFLPGESHGRRSLVGYSPRVAKSRTRLSDFTFLSLSWWGHKELDMTYTLNSTTFLGLQIELWVLAVESLVNKITYTSCDKYGSHSSLSLCIHRLTHVSFILIWLSCLVCVMLFILPSHNHPADHYGCLSVHFSGFIKCILWSGFMQHSGNRKDFNMEKPKTRFLHLILLKSVGLSFSVFQKMGIIHTPTSQGHKSENAQGDVLKYEK